MLQVYTPLPADHDWLFVALAGVFSLLASAVVAAALIDLHSKRKLRQQKILLDTALETMSQGLCMFNADGRIVLCNDRYAAMMGLSAPSLQGLSLLDLLIKYRNSVGADPSDAEQVFARVLTDTREGKSTTKIIKTSANRTLRVNDEPIHQGGGWVSTFDDITEWREAQEQIAYMAHHDALTGLANRTQLMEKLNDALARAEAQRDGVALHFIDLDRFKSVNDTLGHDGGDFLLKKVAERLQKVIRGDDVVARLGGDEFVIVQTGVKNRSQAEDLARRLIDTVIAPIELKEQTIIATVSVGIALAPEDGVNAERLLKSADLALYRAKAEGRNCIRLFLPEMDAEMQARCRLERIIRDAVMHDRFELHYQPLFEMPDRHLIGFEALIRLPTEDGTRHPTTGFHSGRRGLAADRQDRRMGVARGLPHRRDLAGETDRRGKSLARAILFGLSDVVAAALKESGLAAHRLELEITETLLLGNSQMIMTELHALKAMGVAIVMTILAQAIRA